MRTLWLASAASLFIAGAACAQMSQTGPAPTGAPDAATMTNPGQSPGNTAPTTTGSAMSAPSGAMTAPTTTAPTKNASGAPNGAMVTAPGTSPGKTEPAASGMSSTMSTSGLSDKTAFENKPMSHHYGRGMGMGSVGMPNDAPATTYLKIAKHSIMHGNKMMAEDALSHAETRMLDRAVPQGQIAADTDPAVSSIQGARKAVMAGDMKTANMDIDTAMQQTGGMSSGGMSATGSTGMMSTGAPAAAAPDTRTSGFNTGGMSQPAPAGTMMKPPMTNGVAGPGTTP